MSTWSLFFSSQLVRQRTSIRVGFVRNRFKIMEERLAYREDKFFVCCLGFVKHVPRPWAHRFRKGGMLVPLKRCPCELYMFYISRIVVFAALEVTCIWANFWVRR